MLQCNASYYYDASPLTAAEKILFEQVIPVSEYRYSNFRKEVAAWLSENYGADLDVGEKALRIKGSGNRRNADVLPCMQHKRFTKFNGIGDAEKVDGVCFFMPDGTTKVVNYPEKHKDNMSAKNQATGEYLKHTVRIFKNMRNRLVANDALKKGIAPSYYIEGLLYSVPSPEFGTDYHTTVFKCLDWLNKCDRSKLVCANMQYYLLRDDSMVQWPAANCETFISAVTKLWNEWE